jgi:peptidoglycan/LPS O-acetylase OafA/YrhL
MSVTSSPSLFVLPRDVNVRTSTYVVEVDALRALAVGSVILVHSGLMSFGWAGVWVFFVISGFAVTTSLLHAQTGSRWQQLRNFYVRRCLRIWPLYFVLLTLNTVFLVSVHHLEPLRNLPYLLTFTYNFPHGFRDFDGSPGHWSPFGIMWSLAVEEQFYLLFPWAMLWLRKPVLIRFLFGLVGACALVRFGLVALLASMGWDNAHINAVIYSFGPAHFDAFAAGALIALLRPHIEHSLSRARRLSGALIAAACLYLVTIVTLQAIRGPFHAAFHNVVAGVLVGDLKEVFVYPVMWGLSAALLMLTLAREPVVLWLARLPLLQGIGRISFGVYMVHIPIFMLVRNIVARTEVHSWPLPLDRLVVLALAAPITCFIAAVSWQFFEQPILRLRSRFG